MDLTTEIDGFLTEMGCSTLEAAVEHILEETLSSSLPLSPLSPLTPPVPPLLQSADHYQQVDLSGVVGLPPQGAAPHQLEQPQSFMDAASLSVRLLSLSASNAVSLPLSPLTPPFPPLLQPTNHYQQENLSGVVGLPPQGAAPHQLEQPQQFIAAPSLSVRLSSPSASNNVSPPLSPLTPPVLPLLQSADHYQQVDLSGVVGLPLQGAAPHHLQQPQSFMAAPSLSVRLSSLSASNAVSLPLSSLTPPFPPLLKPMNHYQQENLSGVVGMAPQGAAPQQLEQPQSFMAAPSLPVRLSSLSASNTVSLPLSPLTPPFPPPLQPMNHYQQENLCGVVGLPPQGAAPHQLEQPQSFVDAPLLPYVHVPTVTMAPNLIPVGYFNGQVVYRSAGHFIPPDSAAPSLDVRKPKKRKRDDQLEEDQPYIKKPLNAFMMFRKEQRPVLMADMNINDNAIINKLLGERWQLLPKEEQQKYFLKAEEGRLLHILQHPDWSARNNYGRNRSSRRPHTHVGRNTANSSTSSRFSAPQAVVIPSAPQAPQTVMMPFGSMSYDLPDFYGPQQPLQLHHPQQFCPPLPQADWSQYQWASFNPQFPL